MRPHNTRRVLVATAFALSTGTVAVVELAAQATQATTPRHTNRLIGEKSPYLQLHAQNPVDWYPWGPEAFDKHGAI